MHTYGKQSNELLRLLPRALILLFFSCCCYYYSIYFNVFAREQAAYEATGIVSFTVSPLWFYSGFFFSFPHYTRFLALYQPFRNCRFTIGCIFIRIDVFLLVHAHETKSFLRASSKYVSFVHGYFCFHIDFLGHFPSWISGLTAFILPLLMHPSFVPLNNRFGTILWQCFS